MKKFVAQKNASRLNIKKDTFQKHKNQNPKHRSPINSQQTHNALIIQKHVAVYFKDVETEETFSSQDQKPVETTNFVTTTFFEQKITTAQIRFFNNR